MVGFGAGGDIEFRKAIQPRLDELTEEMESLAKLREASSDPTKRDQLQSEIQQKFDEFKALLDEVDYSLY